jgi:hypothetical protein
MIELRGSGKGCCPEQNDYQITRDGYCIGCNKIYDEMIIREALDKFKTLKLIVEKYDISCGEDIYQTEKISEKAFDILYELVSTIGYFEEKKEVEN